MSRAVLISIRPKWCELIASGEKTIEVRKTRPKIETPFKCYIYCTKPSFEYEDFIALDNGRFIYGGGKVIGEFVCDKTEVYDYEYCTHPEIWMDYDCGDNWFCIDDIALKNACMSYEELRAYAGNKDVCGWHISNLVIYDEPKRLSDFIRPSGGCCNEGKCTGCKYLDKGNGYNVEDDCLANFDTDMYSIVTRPPQSFCYVEELP